MMYIRDHQLVIIVNVNSMSNVSIISELYLRVPFVSCTYTTLNIILLYFIFTKNYINSTIFV